MTSFKSGHFQSFFIYFFVPPTLNLKKKSRKSTNKKFWPKDVISLSIWIASLTVGSVIYELEYPLIFNVSSTFEPHHVISNNVTF